MPEAPIVVLVHGWNGWPANWRPLRAGLVRAGYVTYAPRLPFHLVHGCVRDDAAVLRRFLQGTQHHGESLAAQPVVLAGYSRGGLVLRAFARLYQDARIAGMVHIGAPLLGVPALSRERLPQVVGLWEMAEGSGLLRWLLEDLRDLERLPQLAICGRAAQEAGYSDLVVAEESARLGGRLPLATVDLLPTTEAWHGNLINRAWFVPPLPGFVASDRAWPLTLQHLLRFLRTLRNEPGPIWAG